MTLRKKIALLVAALALIAFGWGVRALTGGGPASGPRERARAAYAPGMTDIETSGPRERARECEHLMREWAGLLALTYKKRQAFSSSPPERPWEAVGVVDDETPPMWVFEGLRATTEEYRERCSGPFVDFVESPGDLE